MWYREAQQGRLNLDKQTGVENFREELKALIGQSLVRNKLDLVEYVSTKNFDNINPLGFHVDWKKLNRLLATSPLNKYVRRIDDISPFEAMARASGEIPPKAAFDKSKKIIYIPKLYNKDNLSSFLHEVVHSIDPLIATNGWKDRKKMEEGAKDSIRSYFNRREERLANFENLDDFYSSENLKKVLEIFYIKDKKKYPSVQIATKAFMDDFKNYMQNPLESILYNPTKFHSFLVAANGSDEITNLLTNATSPLTPDEYEKIFGDMSQDDPKFLPKLRQYLKDHPEKKQPRDVQYINQLRKFFTNVYTKNAPQIMPGYESPVMPFNTSQTIQSNSAKNWLVRFISKKKNITLESAQYNLDFLILKRRDLYNKFISTLRDLNIVLDESFNFQDPRWQLLEPIVELILNELIKYLENPQQYKTNLQTDEQRTIKQLNEEITKIINDNTIKDKKAYFLKHWSDSLKKLGTMEQNELLDKFPVMDMNKGLQIMKNIGQK